MAPSGLAFSLLSYAYFYFPTPVALATLYIAGSAGRLFIDPRSPIAGAGGEVVGATGGPGAG